MNSTNKYLQSNPTDSQSLAERIRELRAEMIAKGWDIHHGADLKPLWTVLVELEKRAMLRGRR